MTYTLDQVKPLLTKPELELFQKATPEVMTAMNLRQVNQKITRVRALRDKYRDLYQRQTADTLRQPAAKRSHTGGDNQRTQSKAEVMQQVLQQFEARRDQLMANAPTTSASAKKQRTSKAKSSVSTAEQTQDLSKLVKNVRKAVEKKSSEAEDRQDSNAEKGPVISGNSSDAMQGAVPTDMPAEALRKNPLKAEPVNMKIHASARSQTRAHQAKRDGR